MRSSTSWNGSTSYGPSSFTRSTHPCTTDSGVEAPAVSPTSPVSHSSRISSGPSIRYARAPSAAATSTSRFALLLAGAPTTSTVAHIGAMCLTAFWRFCVA